MELTTGKTYIPQTVTAALAKEVLADLLNVVISPMLVSTLSQGQMFKGSYLQV